MVGMFVDGIVAVSPSSVIFIAVGNDRWWAGFTAGRGLDGADGRHLRG